MGSGVRSSQRKIEKNNKTRVILSEPCDLCIPRGEPGSLSVGMTLTSYSFTAIPSISNRPFINSGPDPRNARAGNSRENSFT